MTDPAFLSELKNWLRGQISPARFAHVQGVAGTAEKLALRWGYSAPKAHLAAWLHDCAKELTKNEMRDLIRGSSYRLDSFERKTPALWHPHAGAALARKKWGIRDREILDAIRRHTLGRPAMGPLAQIVFVADFIEPGRTFSGVALARREARLGMAAGVSAKASMTLAFLLQRKMAVHPRLLETWNYFRTESFYEKK